MKKRREWQRLKRYARKIFVRLLFLTEEQFEETFDSDIFSLFDPINMRVTINQKIMENEDLALFTLAHELGHAVDHISEPHRSEEYHFYYLLDSFYSTFPLDPPEVCRRVFQDREDVATTIGLAILEELEITLDPAKLQGFVFFPNEYDPASRS